MPHRNLGGALEAPLFERIAILGAGLIGSSIARAIRKAGAAKSIVIADSSADVLARAEALQLGDAYQLDARTAAQAADLIIFCVPVGAYAEVAKHIAPALVRGAIVSDVGSVKGAVIASLSSNLPDHVHLVPAHPVAGTEQSGPEAGFASLFINRWCILTPPQGADETAVGKDRGAMGRVRSQC